MKSKYSKLSALLLLVAIPVGSSVWHARQKAPKIEFVRFRQSAPGHTVATFRITNPTEYTYTYRGYSANWPFQSERVKTDDGWKTDHHGYWEFKGGFYGLAPYTSVEFDALPPKNNAPFAVGVRLEQLTLKDRYQLSPGRWDRIRYYLRSKLPEAGPTWSKPIQAGEPAR